MVIPPPTDDLRASDGALSGMPVPYEKIIARYARAVAQAQVAVFC